MELETRQSSWAQNCSCVRAVDVTDVSACVCSHSGDISLALSLSLSRAMFAQYAGLCSPRVRDMTVCSYLERERDCHWNLTHMQDSRGRIVNIVSTPLSVCVNTDTNYDRPLTNSSYRMTTHIEFEGRAGVNCKCMCLHSLK